MEGQGQANGAGQPFFWPPKIPAAEHFGPRKFWPQKVLAAKHFDNQTLAAVPFGNQTLATEHFGPRKFWPPNISATEHFGHRSCGYPGPGQDARREGEKG